MDVSDCEREPLSRPCLWMPICKQGKWSHRPFHPSQQLSLLTCWLSSVKKAFVFLNQGGRSVHLQWSDGADQLLLFVNLYSLYKVVGSLGNDNNKEVMLDSFVCLLCKKRENSNHQAFLPDNLKRSVLLTAFLHSSA